MPRIPAKQLLYQNRGLVVGLASPLIWKYISLLANPETELEYDPRNHTKSHEKVFDFVFVSVISWIVLDLTPETT